MDGCTVHICIQIFQDGLQAATIYLISSDFRMGGASAGLGVIFGSGWNNITELAWPGLAWPGLGRGGAVFGRAARRRGNTQQATGNRQ